MSRDSEQDTPAAMGSSPAPDFIGEQAAPQSATRRTATRGPGRFRALGRTGAPRLLALSDQVLSGLSNFLTVALIARSAAPEDFGRFAVVYALFLTELGLTRKLWGTRLSMTSSTEETLERLRGLLGATLYAAPAGMGVIVLSSLAMIGRQSLPIVVILAIAVPIVVAQDLCRYAAVAAGRPAVAAGSDLAWVVAVAVGYSLRPPMLLAMAIWVVGAALGLVIALIALRLTPSLGGAWAALRERHHTSEVSALATVAASLATYATLGLATWAVSATAAGALRGASTVMAPVNTLFTFVGLTFLPALFRTEVASHARLVARASALLAILVLAWGAVLLVLPSNLGRLLLGDTWLGARSVLPWTTLEYVGLAVYTGLILGFQARRQARVLAVVSFVDAALVVVASAVAAAVATSASAFAAGLATVSLVSAAGTSVVYYWRARARRRDIPTA